jgi:peptide/nickel transport system ATP-binding protein
VSEVAILADIGKSYRGRDILSKVSLGIGPGEIVGVCGHSGSGKSTLLRIAAGIEPPDAGHVTHAGLPVWHGRRRYPGRRGFAMPVFQNPTSSLDARWPIWRSITEPLWHARHTTRHLRDLAGDALDSVGLGHLDLESRPNELSTGQCQRIAVLRALLPNPALIIADEPASALDGASALLVRKLLQRAAAAGSAVMVVSHDVRELTMIGNRVLELDRGALSPLTEGAKLARRPRSEQSRVDLSMRGDESRVS